MVNALSPRSQCGLFKSGCSKVSTIRVLRTGSLAGWRGDEPCAVPQAVPGDAERWSPCQESLDGAWLYFARDDSSRSPLTKMPSGGGPERQVVSAIARRAFAPASKGVYFIQHDSARSASIRFRDEATGDVRVLQVLTKPL